MQVLVDANGVFLEVPQCGLRAICGSRYNTFIPDPDQRGSAEKFFQPAVWKAMVKPVDEDFERWDGMA